MTNRSVCRLKLAWTAPFRCPNNALMYNYPFIATWAVRLHWQLLPKAGLRDPCGPIIDDHVAQGRSLACVREVAHHKLHQSERARVRERESERERERERVCVCVCV